MSTAENTHRVYRFGEFSLDLDREALYRGDDELHLRPKAFRVLKLLLENSGRLISKAELHDIAWKRSVVTDDSLAHCIADIRRALGDSDFEIIKTVPRRGYVFDHAVSSETAAPAEPAARRDRLAFRSGAVAAGLAAALLLLLGAGRLVELPTAGADAGESAVAAAPQTVSPDTGIDAHNEYERGRFFFMRRGAGDIARAEACFKAALELDPDFALAWIGLAGVYSVRVGTGDLDREEGVPLLGDATLHAVRLAPDNAEAHARRAAFYHYAGEPLLEREHLETAVALDPDDVLVLGYAAGSYLQRGRFDEAIDLQRRAIQGDPTSALYHHNLVWMLLAAGRYAEAAVVAEQYRALYPPGVQDSSELLVDVEILQGNYEQALVQAHSMPQGPVRNRNLAIIHHALGQGADAAAALQWLLDAADETAALHAAEVLAQRGEHDKALRWLSGLLDSAQREEASRNRLSQETLWLLSPYLAGLRTDERWQALYSEVLEARGKPKMLALENSRKAARKQ